LNGGTPVNTSTNNQYIVNSASATDAVLYYCTAYEGFVDGANLNLTLYRKTIRVNVLPCGSTINPTDSLALVALYDGTNGSSWTNNTNWKKGKVSTWNGVTTNTPYDRVTALDLNINNLTGPIPSAIGNLSALTSLNLNNNSLTGPIPPSIGNLTNLTSLSLNSCSLTGSLPAGIGNLTQLNSFVAEVNQLTGSLPSSIENLKSLTYLSFFGNQLSGSLESLCELDQISYLNLAYNQFSGALQEEFFYFDNTQISGFG
jgi:Leucine-rich repeat (LRR) protein